MSVPRKHMEANIMLTRSTKRRISEDKISHLTQMLDGLTFQEWLNISYYTDTAYQKRAKPAKSLATVYENQNTLLIEEDLDTLSEILANEPI